MSLVNVNCINCNAEFKITKEAANSSVTGLCLPAEAKYKVVVTVSLKALPAEGELCPRCALAAMRVVLNSFETEIPNLMAGEHLKEQIT